MAHFFGLHFTFLHNYMDLIQWTLLLSKSTQKSKATYTMDASTEYVCAEKLGNVHNGRFY